MHTTIPFQSQFRPDLSLKRRGNSNIHAPMESDTNTPFEEETPLSQGQAALHAAWDKLYRARAILEAEQAHLRDDRIAIQGEVDALDAREQAVSARELRMKQLELQIALAQAEEEDERESESTISKLTKAPFHMVSSVFGQKK